MDHVINVNPYLNSEDKYDAEAEEKLRQDIEAKQAAEQAEIDRKLEEAQAQVEENNRKLAEQVEVERERQAQENAEAREVKEYDTVLAESNLVHVRQPNEAPENYIDVPNGDDINVTDNDIHNDGELDGEFGRFQTVKEISLDEVIRAEQEEREKKIAKQYEVMDVFVPVIPEGFQGPPATPVEQE